MSLFTRGKSFPYRGEYNASPSAQSLPSSRGSVRSYGSGSTYCPEDKSAPAGSSDYPGRQKRSSNSIIIALFGMTGTGKSSFIEKVVGNSVQIGHGLRSCTSSIAEVECQIGPYTVTLVDTPGFDDTNRSDTEILSLIAQWMQASYETNTLLSGMIYLYRISDPRMGRSSIKNLSMFRQLVGADNMENVLLTTTMWDKVSLEEGERREDDLIHGKGSFWGPMIASGSRPRRHHNTRQSALSLIQEIIDCNGPRLLKIQKEMADGRSLIDTEAGKSINEEIIMLQKQHQGELARVKEEMQAAVESGNRAMQRQMEANRETIIEEMTESARQQRLLYEKKQASLEASFRRQDEVHQQSIKNLESQHQQSIKNLESQLAAAKLEAEEDYDDDDEYDDEYEDDRYYRQNSYHRHEAAARLTSQLTQGLQNQLLWNVVSSSQRVGLCPNCGGSYRYIPGHHYSGCPYCGCRACPIAIA